MKTQKLFLVALFVIFGMSLFAQNETKSANVIKQRLDSVVYVGNNTKTDYLYNNSGYNTSQIYYHWNNAKMKYETSSKYEYEYDLKGNCIIIQRYTWDETQNKWIRDNDKIEQGFDEFDQLLITNKFDWNTTTNKWELSSKTDYENVYDNRNNLFSVAKKTTHFFDG